MLRPYLNPYDKKDRLGSDGLVPVETIQFDGFQGRTPARCSNPSFTLLHIINGIEVDVYGYFTRI